MYILNYSPFVGTRPASSVEVSGVSPLRQSNNASIIIAKVVIITELNAVFALF